MTVPFQPPPEGFIDALRRARARRHRRHVWEGAVGASAVAALAVFALASNPGGLISLRQEQTAGQGLRGSTTTSSPALTSPTPIRTPTRTPAAGSTNGTAPVTNTAPAVQSGPSAPGSLVISTPPARTTTTYSNLTPCADTSGRQATGWCVQPGNSFTGRAGQANTLSVSLCRLPGALDGQASFPNTMESTFSMHPAGAGDQTLWDLAAQHPGQPNRHSVAVPAGQCLTWTLTWYGKDNTGRNLPADRYTLEVGINADNIGTPNQVVVENYDYTITN